MKDNLLIFDNNRYRHNLRRSFKRFSNHDFLFQEDKNNIASRLLELQINANFVLEIGARGVLSEVVKAKQIYVQTSLSSDFLNNKENSILTNNDLLCFKNNSFDLILSSLELQMLNDLPNFLIQIFNILKKQGYFIFTIIGGTSLLSLRKVILEAESSLNLPNCAHIVPMIDMQDLTKLVQIAGFKNIVVDSYDVSISYEKVINLMQDLRYMGFGNNLIKRSNRSISKTLLDKIENIYTEKFSFKNKLISKFEIFTVTVKK